MKNCINDIEIVDMKQKENLRMLRLHRTADQLGKIEETEVTVLYSKKIETNLDQTRCAHRFIKTNF